LREVIHIEPLAPAKPALGAPCNGCGVCCLAEPCPLGMLLSGARRGACTALRWQADSLQYRCGALVQPREVLAQSALRRWPRLAALAVALLRRYAQRWIASGSGCDCSLEPQSGT